MIQRWLVLIFLSIVAISPQGFADGVDPPPVDLDQSFLLLPAFDLERFGSGPVHVGDKLVLKVQGLNSEIQSVAVPAGTPDLQEAGWDLDISKGTAGDVLILAGALKVGRVIIPSLKLLDAAGKPVARTNPQTFDVETAIAANDDKKDQPADLAPPLSTAFPTWLVISLTIFGITVIGVIVYIVYRYFKSKRPVPVQASEVIKPEDMIALAIFADLEKSGILLRGEYKKYYFKISDALKEYLGRRYCFDAPESTTAELIRELKIKNVVSESFVIDLQSLFEEMDVVKFTDVKPSQEEGRKVLERARKWVLQTRQLHLIHSSVEVKSAP